MNGSPTPSVTGRRPVASGATAAVARDSSLISAQRARSAGLRSSDRAISRASTSHCRYSRFCACWNAAVRSSGSSLPLVNADFSSGRSRISRIASFCQKQKPNATTNAARQMMIRVRSSSRCSTRLRRSSCAIGRSAVAMARCGSRALAARALALVDDLAVDRRGVVGATERSVGLLAVVVVLVEIAVVPCR